MTKDEYIEYCKNLPQALVDRPFNNDYDSYTARHETNRKWFALIMTVGGRDIVNIKLEQSEGDFYRRMYKDITAGWHMNKLHWNTIYLDGDVPDEVIKQLTEKSFELTRPKIKAKKVRTTQKTKPAP